MLKKLSAVVVAAALAGCQPYAEEVTYPVMPEGLKDCRTFVISDGSVRVRVVRCPNSQTSTTRPGKGTTHSTVVEK